MSSCVLINVEDYESNSNIFKHFGLQPQKKYNVQLNQLKSDFFSFKNTKRQLIVTSSQPVTKHN